MPLNPAIKKVLVLGSGPIVIGQAAEFDYAGTQACRALKEEGLEVVLVNSNPATIMTDKDIADHVYIEPLNIASVTQIIEKEKPDSILPTLGGQTGLNLAMNLHEQGILAAHNVRLLGTSPESIRKAEDRQGFKDCMESIGQPCVTSDVVETVEDAVSFAGSIGALASKATGYPIAKVAAKVALGYTLDEIPNAVTGKTSAFFEPTIDYCVLKIPRLPFDKFTTASRTLGTQMKATGEVMAIAPTFEGALMKAIRSLEQNVYSLRMEKLAELYTEEIEEKLANVDDERLFVVAEALRRGFSPKVIHDITKIDLWFLDRLRAIVDMEEAFYRKEVTEDNLRVAKEMGFSDAWIGELCGRPRKEIKALRESYGIRPSFKMVDTCAAEFDAQTPYYYSTYGL